MPYFDREILIRNIKKLMTDNGIKQEALAKILGMSQPNISKALSTDSTSKKCFTLDQIIGIAKHFNVSIDVLVGNQQALVREISPRSIAEYFVRLIEHGDLKIIKHTVDEEIFEPFWDTQSGCPDYKQYKKPIEYNAFYFPKYWHIPSGLDYEEEGALFSEMANCGNETRHSDTNKFFHQFLQIYSIYKQKGLEEDTYRTVVSDLLSHLRE